MRWWRLACSFTIAMAVACPGIAVAGKLGAVRSAVRGDSGSSSGSGSSSSSSSSGSGWFSGSSDDDDDDGWLDDDDDCDDDDDNTVSSGAAGILWSPGSDEPCCDDPIPEGVVRYPRYPYADNERGYVERVPESEKDERGRLFAGRATLEGGYMGDNVWRSGLGLRLAYWRLGFENELHFYLEQPLRDALYLGTSNLTFDLVMRPKVQLRVGGGLNYMIDGRTPGEGHREYAAGGNFTSTVDVFPVKPLVLSGRFDYGKLYKARVLTARATVGFLLHGVELFGGYEVKMIGDVPLYGPVAGLRLWF